MEQEIMLIDVVQKHIQLFPPSAMISSSIALQNKDHGHSDSDRVVSASFFFNPGIYFRIRPLNTRPNRIRNKDSSVCSETSQSNIN
jgi:hypothetical protein